MRRRCSFPLRLIVLSGFLVLRPAAALAAHPHLIINEVLANPVNESTGEFVEVFNTGDEPVDVKGWRLADPGDANDTIVDFTGPHDVGLPGTIIPAGGYALIVDPEYAGAYHAFLVQHADSTRLVMLTITGDRTLGNGLGNSGDTVLLDDGAGSSTQFVWTSDAGEGVSWEKIRPTNGESSSNRAPSRDPSGSTPGAQNSVTPPRYDAGIVSQDVTLFPSQPSVGEEVTITALVRNHGLDTLSSIQVMFFVDVDGDSLPGSSEWIGSMQTAGPLAPDDSVLVSVRWPAASSGRQRIGVQVTASGDARLDNNAALIELRVAFPSRAFVINELMYTPSPGDPEWIELLNVTDHPVDVSGWTVEDADSTARRSLIAGHFLIAPSGFLIVTADSSDFVATFPDVTVPVLRPLHGFPSLSNAGDVLTLRDLTGRVIDRVQYTSRWGGSDGRSLERRLPEGASQDSVNWGTSRAAARSTPGLENSLTPPLYDLGLRPSDLVIQPPSPGPDDTAIISVVIRNTGRLAIADARVSLYEDRNADHHADPDEVIGQDQVVASAIPPGDSVVIAGSGVFPSGLHRVTAHVMHPFDEEVSNDWAMMTFVVWFRPGTIILNELMYAPKAGDPEWVELQNLTDTPVNVAGWTIENADSTRRSMLSMQEAIILPRGYAVIAADSVGMLAAFPGLTVSILNPVRWPVFKNTGDAVVIRDLVGRIMDRVEYSSRWGGMGGRSLERRSTDIATQDSTNWEETAVLAGGTPGRSNSVTPPLVDVSLPAGSLIIASIAEGEQPAYEVTVVVHNVGQLPASDLRIDLFDDRDGDGMINDGEVIGTALLSDRTVVPGQEETVRFRWSAVSGGLHTVVARVAQPADTTTVNDRISVRLAVPFPEHALVINEIMFDPGEGHAEWVEVFNRSRTMLDLAGWTIESTDSTRPRQIAAGSVLITPGGYAVVVSDTAAFRETFSSEASLTVLLPSGWPGLRNTGARLTLRDLTGAIIDRVDYHPNWGGGVGRSIERIHPDQFVADSTTWGPSAAASGGTPGSRNSLFASTIPERMNVELSPNPFSPDGDGDEDVMVIALTFPVTHAVVRLVIYDVTGRPIRTLLDQEPTGSRRMLTWDGRDDQGRRARIGLYILWVEMVQPHRGRVQALKRTVALAGRL